MPPLTAKDYQIRCYVCNTFIGASTSEWTYPGATSFVHDPDFNAPVCVDCARLCRNASALLAMPFAAPSDGLPASPIALKGCYHGSDAPDNT